MFAETKKKLKEESGADSNLDIKLNFYFIFGFEIISIKDSST